MNYPWPSGIVFSRSQCDCLAAGKWRDHSIQRVYFSLYIHDVELKQQRLD
jgi:hypothetical protein